jgi:Flp pilus assembly protein CpaB
MYAPTTLPRKEVEVGAISDPQYLSGRAASIEIFPGQQFTATDFAASDTASVDSQITGTQRAISISIDGVAGSSSQIMPGDYVDIYMGLGGTVPAGQGLVKLFKPNVKVITTPAVPGPAGGSNLVLLVNSKDVSEYLYAANHSQLYFAIRPVVGAKKTVKSTATAASLLR